MTPDEERVMAFRALLQWTQAVVAQSARVSEARDHLSSLFLGLGSTPQERLQIAQQRRQARHAFHTECHFFAIAAYKLLEYREWALTCGSCPTVDFGELAQFSVQDIRDLRNMREHVVEYFKGAGNVKDRWAGETPEYRADASSVVRTMIGGRLDWVAFGSAAARLLPQLIAEPIPYPARPRQPPPP